MIKRWITSGMGAGFIALGGMGISVATGFVADFKGWHLMAYILGCVLLALVIYWREKLIGIQTEEKENTRRKELEGNFEDLKQETENAKDSYIKSQKDLEEIIRLMPPAHTMHQFSLTYGSLHNSVRIFGIRAMKTKQLDQEELSSLIRQGLDALCWLMQRYQPNSNENPVSANLMRFHRIEGIKANEELKAFVEKHLRFVAVESNKLQNLAGVLTLEKEHSATTKTKDPNDMDESIEPIALPVPDTRLYGADPANAIEYYIPVAPRGFGAGYQYHPDLNTLTDESYYDNIYFDKGVRDELILYFKEKISENQIHSILSIGVGKKFTDEDSERIAWGVINIHSPKTNSMTEDMIRSYIHVARPILEVIKDLLSLHSELI